MATALAKYWNTTPKKITLMIDLVDSEAEQIFNIFGDDIYDMIKDGEVSERCASLFKADTDMEKIQYFVKYNGGKALK